MQVTTVKLFKFYKNLGDLFAIHSNKKTIRKKAQIPGEMKINELHSDMCRKYIACSYIVHVTMMVDLINECEVKTQVTGFL